MGLIGNGLLGQMSQGGLSRRRPASGPPPFTPASITGLHTWLAGDMGTFSDDEGTIPTTEEGEVAFWEDQSGNGHHAYQTVVSKQPLLFDGWLAFDSVDDFVEWDAGTFSELTDAELFLVLQLDADPPGAAAQSGSWVLSGTPITCHYPFTNGIIYDGWGATARSEVGDPAQDLSEVHCYGVSSSPTTWTARINNVDLFADGVGVGWPANSKLGESLNTGHHLAGVVAEKIVYSRTLTSEERGQVYAYLVDKYSIGG